MQNITLSGALCNFFIFLKSRKVIDFKELHEQSLLYDKYLQFFKNEMSKTEL